MAGLLTPEEALLQFRNLSPDASQERRDWLANELFANYGDTQYGAKGYTPGGMLSPQEQMQIEWLRANKGQNSGNNKDDRIKRIRKLNNMANERLDGDQRYIIRNKIDQAGRADGLTSGDVFQIGDYTQRDTGKDDGLLQQVINKGLPGFDVGDVTSLPGIDLVALAAAPYTGGASLAVLEGLKAVEQGELTPEAVVATVGAMGGWGALKDAVLGAGGASLPQWMQDLYTAGEDFYNQIADSEFVQNAQDIWGNIRDFTDPLEDIFGTVGDLFAEFDVGPLEDYLPGRAKEYTPTELLPIEYQKVSGQPVDFLYSFEDSIV